MHNNSSEANYLQLCFSHFWYCTMDTETTKQNSDISEIIVKLLSTFSFPGLTRILLQQEQFICYLFIHMHGTTYKNCKSLTFLHRPLTILVYSPDFEKRVLYSVWCGLLNCFGSSKYKRECMKGCATLP